MTTAPRLHHFQAFQFTRNSLLALLAMLAFFASTTSSFAGAAELKKLNEALAGVGKTVATATTAELQNAITTVLTANPKIKPGVVFGEVLKGAGSNAPDIGSQLAARVLTDFSATKITVATDAVKTAGGSKGNVSKIPDFAAGLALDQAMAILLAQNTKAAKAGSGAVLGGFASTLADDAAKQAFANTVLQPDNKLTGNPLEIAKYISQTVTDAVAFTNTVAGLDANSKLAEKLVVGTVAGKPMDAGAVTDAALNINNPAKPGAANLLISKAAMLAKTIGAVADIEQIQKVGEQIAKRIGLPLANVNRVKLSQATTIATSLAKAIIAKPVPATQSINERNRHDNKVDELGELAAYMLAAFSTSEEFTALTTKGTAKTADKTVIALLKAIVNSAKTKVPGTTGPLLLDVAKYVGGSIGLTVSNLPAGVIKTAIIAALNDPKKIDPIAKGLKIDAAMFKAAIADGLDGEPTGQMAGKYENGFEPTNGFGSSLTDPETNYRNM